MSKSTQVALWIAVAVLVVGGLVIWMVGNQTAAPSPAAQAPNASTTNQAAAGQTSGNSMVSNSTSDAAFQGDLANIDSQMNSFSSDSASIDQGLNDQPVQQQQL